MLLSLDLRHLVAGKVTAISKANSQALDAAAETTAEAVSIAVAKVRLLGYVPCWWFGSNAYARPSTFLLVVALCLVPCDHLPH